jgi:hypothetical protein
MAVRWPIVVGIAAISGGIAWFALRDGGHREPASTPHGEARLPAPGAPGPAAIRAPAGPALGANTWAQPHSTDPPRPELPPASPVGSGAPPAAATEFGAQSRDPEWAPATETEIKKRFRAMRGAKLEATECRQDQCLLTVAGSEAEVGKTIAELEGPRGLHGFARNVLLTAPETRDGKMVLRAYALFDR